jgi:Leucine Rich repeat
MMEPDSQLAAEMPPKLRWFHPTPARLLIVLLVIEGILLLSKPWFPKGYAVLTAIASVGVTMMLMLIWFGLALVCHWRFQFILRSLLVATVAVAIPFSWLAVEMKKAREQREVVEIIIQAGGHVWFQDDKPRFVEFWRAPYRSPATMLSGPSWLRRWIGDDCFRYVAQVDFGDQSPVRISDESLEQVVPHLERLSTMETLCLDSTNITGTGLVHLEKLTNVKNIMIDNSRLPLTDEGLKQLCQLQNLETLNLRNTEVTDEGLSHLRNLTHLRCFFVYSRKVTRKGLSILVSLPSLREAILGDANITERDQNDPTLCRSNLKILFLSYTTNWTDPIAHKP